MTDNLERRDLVDKADAWDAIAAKNAEITRLQEALAAAEARIVAAYVSLTNCPHDMGYDLECGPIGCRLDLTSEGGCVCAGVGPALAPPSLPNKEDRNGC